MVRALWVFIVLACVSAEGTPAQTLRIRSRIDEANRVRLQSKRTARLAGARDLGRVAASMPMHLMLRFSPSPDQQNDLGQLLAELQSPASPNYRKWLTPEQYGDRFGLAQSDIDRISEWLGRNGLRTVRVARSRSFLAVSGTAAQVERAFGVEIRRLDVNGEAHFASLTSASIPRALSGVVTRVK